VGNPPGDEDAFDYVGEFLDQALDLTARFLSDRAELSASAAFVLNRVCREGPIRLTTLAVKEAVSQPSMTQLVQRLERLGFVTRLPDPDDGRASLVGVTPHGRTMLDERKRVRRARLALLMTTLTPDESCALQVSARVAYPVLCQLAENADCSPEYVPAHPEDQREVCE
jgi:DNA-binding MarR family transcriptional regulator